MLDIRSMPSRRTSAHHASALLDRLLRVEATHGRRTRIRLRFAPHDSGNLDIAVWEYSGRITYFPKLAAFQTVSSIPPAA